MHRTPCAEAATNHSSGSQRMGPEYLRVRQAGERTRVARDARRGREHKLQSWCWVITWQPLPCTPSAVQCISDSVHVKLNAATERWGCMMQPAALRHLLKHPLRHVRACWRHTCCERRSRHKLEAASSRARSSVLAGLTWRQTLPGHQGTHTSHSFGT